MRAGGSAAIAYSRAAYRPARALPAHVRAAEGATAVSPIQKAIRQLPARCRTTAVRPGGPLRDSRERAIRNARWPPPHASTATPRPLRGVLEARRDLLHGGRHILQALTSVGLFAALRRGQHHRVDEMRNRSLGEPVRILDVSVGSLIWRWRGRRPAWPHDSRSAFRSRHQLCYDRCAIGDTPLRARRRSAHALWLVGREAESLHSSDLAIKAADEMDHPTPRRRGSPIRDHPPAPRGH